MPIEQGTIISVIIAGRNFREAYTELSRRIIDMNTERLIAPDKFSAEWEHLYRLVVAPFATAVKDATLLEIQHEHYRIHGRDNERRAHKALMKRRIKGTTPRKRSQRTINTVQTSPSALIPLASSTAPYNPNALSPNPINAAEITAQTAAEIEAAIIELGSAKPEDIKPPPFGSDEWKVWIKTQPDPNA